MFIDSSALVALLAREPDQPRIAAAIERADVRRTTPLVRLETAMVLSTLLNVEPEDADASITATFDEAGIEVVPITDDVARPAVAAFARYGKGRDHPARLNLADCLIYAAGRAADAVAVHRRRLQPHRNRERARRSAPNHGVTTTPPASSASVRSGMSPGGYRSATSRRSFRSPNASRI